MPRTLSSSLSSSCRDPGREPPMDWSSIRCCLASAPLVRRTAMPPVFAPAQAKSACAVSKTCMTRAGGRTAIGRFAMYRSRIATADIADPSGSVRTIVDAAAAPNRHGSYAVSAASSAGLCASASKSHLARALSCRSIT
eukprot:5612055-Prymnesium_polylepis.2